MYVCNVMYAVCLCQLSITDKIFLKAGTSSICLDTYLLLRICIAYNSLNSQSVIVGRSHVGNKRLQVIMGNERENGPCGHLL